MLEKNIYERKIIKHLEIIFSILNLFTYSWVVLQNYSKSTPFFSFFFIYVTRAQTTIIIPIAIIKTTSKFINSYRFGAIARKTNETTLNDEDRCN